MSLKYSGQDTFSFFFVSLSLGLEIQERTPWTVEGTSQRVLLVLLCRNLRIHDLLLMETTRRAPERPPGAATVPKLHQAPAPSGPPTSSLRGRIRLPVLRLGKNGASRMQSHHEISVKGAVQIWLQVVR